MARNTRRQYLTDTGQEFFSRAKSILADLKDGKTTPITVKGLLDANDGQILQVAALDGLGILVQPSYIVCDDIAAGRLVPVLDDWDLPRLTINLADPSRKYLSAKVRTFIDFMAAHFLKMDFERKWTARFNQPTGS